MLIDLLLNLQKLFCIECSEKRYVFFSCSHFNLIHFTSTEFCTILTQSDVIQGGLKLTFRLHGKNMPNYTRVEISTLSWRQDWNNHRAKISTRFEVINQVLSKFYYLPIFSPCFIDEIVATVTSQQMTINLQREDISIIHIQIKYIQFK